MLEKNSPFLNEGKNLLIEEFGKDYGTYFSILELLSMGRTSRSEIESILQINSGGYLDRLEKLFHQLLAETNKYNQIGTYWERGNKNKIDIVAISDVDNTLLIGDVKVNPKKIRINELKQKAISIEKKYNEYRIEYRGFSET